MGRVMVVTGWRLLRVRGEWWPALDAVRRSFGFDTVWTGGARGVDEWIELWAKDRELQVERFPAPWELAKQGGLPVAAAGPIRNENMLLGRRDFVLEHGHLVPRERVPGTVVGLMALPGGAGTLNTVKLARAREITVTHPYPPHGPIPINAHHYPEGLPPGAVYVGREWNGFEASPLGNRFRGRDALRLYRSWLAERLAAADHTISCALDSIDEGALLACWCKDPAGGRPCHADVIVSAWWHRRRSLAIGIRP